MSRFLFQVLFLYANRSGASEHVILIQGDLFTRAMLVTMHFTETEMPFQGEKNDSTICLFPFRVDREKAFPDPRIFLRGLYGPMHSRIAFLADSYVAMLHNRYVRTYIHTYVYGSYVSNQLRSRNS